MKMMSIVGARPQFIKIAPLVKCISEKGHKSTIVHTGQHYDGEMSGSFFRDLGIPAPDYNLNAGSGTHGHQTGIMLEHTEHVLAKEHPDIVIVYGDTNSTIAGALAAAKMNIPIAHVEAGLRSFDREMPEEINRVVVDHISTFLFCPTSSAVMNLEREGILEKTYCVGDVMADSFAMERIRAMESSKIIENLHLVQGNYMVATIHRPSNTDNPEHLFQVLLALGDLDRQVVLPAHPRLSHEIASRKMEVPKNVIITKPLGYHDMLRLLASADHIITDSGGIQKEAYMLGIPCVTLRNTTEWTETLQGNWNILAWKASGSARQRLRTAMLNSVPTRPRKDVFWPGASSRIVSILEEELC